MFNLPSSSQISAKSAFTFWCEGSDQGEALQFLRQKWKFVAQKTVVCGNSGNDIALFASS